MLRLDRSSPVLLGAPGAQLGGSSRPRPAWILAQLRISCSVQILRGSFPLVISLAGQIRAQAAHGSSAGKH